MGVLEETHRLQYRFGIDLDTYYRIMTDVDLLREIRGAMGDRLLECKVSSQGNQTTIRQLMETRAGGQELPAGILANGVKIKLDYVCVWTRNPDGKDTIVNEARVGKGGIRIRGVVNVTPGIGSFSADAALTVRVDAPLLKKMLLRVTMNKAKTVLVEDFEYAERVIVPRLDSALRAVP
jgi:hypothetical protein